ncbi:MAG: nuclear transport factor 2 family protein [Pseudomonadota bacterium]
MTEPVITAEEHASFDEHDEVAEALNRYIDAARTGDAGLMRDVWFDHARVVGSIGGNPVNLTAKDFCDMVDGRDGSPDLKARIASIDISGDAAVARIEFDGLAGKRFTDFMILYRREGVWRISGKVYDAHSQS